MSESIGKKDKMLCVFSIVLIIASYGAERLIELFAAPQKVLSLLMAMAFSALLAAVYFIVSKTNNSFFGLLVALIGYKMMPPSIPVLDSVSVDGAMLYYIIQKVGVVIFVLLIIKFYAMQGSTKQIKSLPLLAIMFATPFFYEVGERLGAYLMYELGGSMLYSYFTQFACYIVSALVVLLVAYKSNYDSLRFVAYYEFVALGINVLRRAGLIVSLAIKGEHISKSHFVWVAVFAVCAAMFYFTKEYRKKRLA